MPNRVPDTFSLADLHGRLFATVSETAAILRADPRTVRKGISNGTIPATRTGAEWRVPCAWLREQVWRTA